MMSHQNGKVEPVFCIPACFSLLLLNMCHDHYLLFDVNCVGTLAYGCSFVFCCCFIRVRRGSCVFASRQKFLLVLLVLDYVGLLICGQIF